MRITNIHQSITEADFLEKVGKENFVKPQKGDADIAASLQISDEAQKRFEEDIIHFDRSASNLPEYCGRYETDKAIATALENCSKEEQGFVYDIIRQNFLLENTSYLTEEERQANISLGMKKAQYAAENFIPEEHRKAFLDAMETIAKLATAGKADKNGNMNYGTTKGSYLGHGSNLVATTDTLGMMKSMDSAAYEEYQKIGAESSNENRPLNQLKYLTNWYIKTLKQKPTLLEEYEEKNKAYFEKEVNSQEVPSHFNDIDISSRETFLSGLRNFMAKHPNFMTGILAFELENKFWEN